MDILLKHLHVMILYNIYIHTYKNCTKYLYLYFIHRIHLGDIKIECKHHFLLLYLLGTYKYVHTYVVYLVFSLLFFLCKKNTTHVGIVWKINFILNVSYTKKNILNNLKINTHRHTELMFLVNIVKVFPSFL